MGRKSKKNCSKIVEGGQHIYTNLVEKILQRVFNDADESCRSPSKIFDRRWRYTMCKMCIGLPFSRLVSAFHIRYETQIKQNSPSQMQLQNHHKGILGALRDFSDNSYEYQECPNLDFDAIEEILRRLPVPSLMRTKTVCKNWNRAISATTSSLLNVEDCHLFVMQHMVQGFQGISFFSSALNRWFRIPLFRQKKWGWYSHYRTTQLYLCAAAAGFYLFLDYEGSLCRKLPIVINPVTKQCIELPPLPDGYGWTKGTAIELIAQSGHFDIIALGFYERETDYCTLLYNSITDMWTSTHAMPAIPSHIILTAAYRTRHPWTSALHNGVVYFTHNYGLHLGCYDIVSKMFQFKEIEGGLPPQIDSNSDENTHISMPSLVTCNGKLLLVGRLEKEVGEGGSTWGGIPFIEHALVGIWELNSDNTWFWSLISVTPRDLFEDTVKSSQGTDFMVAALSHKIWLTIRGSRNVMTLDLRSMEWSALPGCPTEDTVDTYPRTAVCGTLSICNLPHFN